MLLVDIKMPRNCYECPFIDKDIRIGDSCVLTTPGKECENYSHSRPDWCPLVEVNNMKTEWIKVTYKLPALWKNVLVQYADGDVLVASLEQYPNGEMNWCWGEGWSDFDEVVAWMPLPDPFAAL